MVYELQYKIADMRFALRSDFMVSSNDVWNLFACRDHCLDFLYECHMHEKMPALTGRRYYDPIRERDYALTEEFADKMHIHLTAENLPWGSEIAQLYPQLALPHILLHRKKLLLHASYILTEHGALIFTAPSGTGKSTQAELWKRFRNAFIVNGDRAVISVKDGQAYAHGFPLSGSSSDCHNRTEKLLAIVSLRQAPQNEVHRLSASEALTALINGSYLPDEFRADMPQLVDTALVLAQSVPILQLSCTPDETAVEALEQALIKP